jgi:hypothetical protein
LDIFFNLPLPKLSTGKRRTAYSEERFLHIQRNTTTYPEERIAFLEEQIAYSAEQIAYLEEQTAYLEEQKSV